MIPMQEEIEKLMPIAFKELRKEGISHNKIVAILGISKTTSINFAKKYRLYSKRGRKLGRGY